MTAEESISDLSCALSALLEASGAPMLVVAVEPREVGRETGWQAGRQAGQGPVLRGLAANGRWLDAAAAFEPDRSAPLLPAAAAALLAPDIELAAGGVTVEREREFEAADGEPRRWRTVAAPLPPVTGASDADAGVRRVLLTVLDQTAARRVERAARMHDRRFRAIVAQLPVGVSLKDDAGRYILVNRQQATWFGFEPTAAIGRRPSDMLSRDNALRAEERDRAALDEGRVTREELRTRVADGSVRDFMIVSFPVLDDDGVVGACTLMIDNTSLKNVERALQISEERFRDFAESAADWLWETDMDQRFSFISGTPLLTDRSLVLGHTRQEVIARLGGDGAGFCARVGALMAEGRSFHDLVYEVRGAGGEPVFVRLTGKPVRDETGRVVGYRGTSADVTERHRAAMAAIEAKEQAELASRTKSEFLANMSHELRTPLNAIIGFSESLESGVFGTLDPRQRDYLRDIRLSGQHLLGIINDILDVAKIEAGKAVLYEDEFRIDDLVDASIRLIGPRAREQGLALDASVPAGLPPLRGDVRRLKQVLLNLLSNAVKFTEPPGTVTVSAAVDTEGLVLVVRDTGIGIAPRDREKVLAPFGQVDGRLARRHAGTGLGLPLSKALVELHGGTLGIDSEPGMGTAVTVRLPRDRLGHA